MVRGFRIAWPVALLLAGTLAACGSSNELPGRGYMPPSDVTVSRTMPLTVPPDFGLRPEAAIPVAEGGVTVLEEQAAVEQIDIAVLDASMAEQSLLLQAGVLGADPVIRRTLERENAILAGDPQFVDQLLYGEFISQPQVQLEEGPEVEPDVAIEQGEIVDDTWLKVAPA